MLAFVSFVLTILQWLVLFILVGTFVFITLAGFYMTSPFFRSLVLEFQAWEHRRRFRRQIRRGLSEGNPRMMQAYAKADVEFTAQMFGRKPTFGTVYDEVAFNRQIDPRIEARARKAQDAADQDIIDRATEYHHGITE